MRPLSCLSRERLYNPAQWDPVSIKMANYSGNAALTHVQISPSSHTGNSKWLKAGWRWFIFNGREVIARQMSTRKMSNFIWFFVTRVKRMACTELWIDSFYRKGIGQSTSYWFACIVALMPSFKIAEAVINVTMEVYRCDDDQTEAPYKTKDSTKKRIYRKERRYERMA